jgi:ADP-ribose pyrophosphatase
MQTYLAAYATHVRHAVVARGRRKVAEPNPDEAEFLELLTLPVEEYL